FEQPERSELQVIEIKRRCAPLLVIEPPLDARDCLDQLARVGSRAQIEENLRNATAQPFVPDQPIQLFDDLSYSALRRGSRRLSKFLNLLRELRARSRVGNSGEKLAKCGPAPRSLSSFPLSRA